MTASKLGPRAILHGRANFIAPITTTYVSTAPQFVALKTTNFGPNIVFLIAQDCKHWGSGRETFLCNCDGQRIRKSNAYEMKHLKTEPLKSREKTKSSQFREKSTDEKH